MTRSEACALAEHIANDEREAALHDPRGELPDEAWQRITYGQVAALNAALKGLGWAMVAAYAWWHPGVQEALRRRRR